MTASLATPAVVLGHVRGRAVVRVHGGLLLVDDQDAALPDGAEATLLAYEGDDRPLTATALGRITTTHLGRYQVTTQGGLALLERADPPEHISLVLQPGQTLPSSLRLWIVRGLTAPPDPKVFGPGQRCPRVSPAETHLHYLFGLGHSENPTP